MWYAELNLEYDQLKEKIVRLRSYINLNDDYKKLKFSYKMLMKLQLFIMKQYLNILQKRLSYGTKTFRRDS